VDADDATKVLAVKGDIKAIGKSIAPFNAFDTGVFLCTPAFFEAAAEGLKRGDTTLSGGVRALSASGRARAMGIEGAWWMDVDDEESYRKAEKYLSGGSWKGYEARER
jgi:choline kinase